MTSKGEFLCEVPACERVGPNIELHGGYIMCLCREHRRQVDAALRARPEFAALEAAWCELEVTRAAVCGHYAHPDDLRKAHSDYAAAAAGMRRCGAEYAARLTSDA